MPYIDPSASARVKELREPLGYSPERLAAVVRARATREGWDLGGIDAYTIRRIEGTDRRWGLIPGLRVRVLLETYFETRIWKQENRIWVPSDRREAMAA